MQIRKLFFRGLLFITFFYLVTFLFQEFIFFCARKVNTGLWGKYNKVVEGKINAEIVILGTSRAFGHYNSKIISDITNKKVYNLGTEGTKISYQLPLIKSYLSHNKTPGMIVFVTDYNSVGYEQEIKDPFHNLPYLDDEEIYNGRLTIDKYFWLHKYIPAYNLYYFNAEKQYELFLGIFYTLSKQKDTYIDGYHAYKETFDTTILITQIAKRFPDNFTNKPMDINYYMYLKELLEICKKKHIELVFISSPEYPEITLYQKNRESVMNIYRKMAKENDLRYFDYTFHPAFRKQYFFGFNHLNKNGAELFSSIAAHDLMRTDVKFISYSNGN